MKTTSKAMTKIITLQVLILLLVHIIAGLAQDRTKKVTSSQDKVKIKSSQSVYSDNEKQITVKKAKVDSLYKEIAKANQSIKNYSYEIANLQKEISMLERLVWESKMKIGSTNKQ